jgi:hypothetical protein
LVRKRTLLETPMESHSPATTIEPKKKNPGIAPGCSEAKKLLEQLPGEEPEFRLSVNFAAMTNPYKPDNQLPISDLTYQSIVTDTIAPFLVITFESLAAKARIVCCLNFVHKRHNLFCCDLSSRAISFCAPGE